MECTGTSRSGRQIPPYVGSGVTSDTFAEETDAVQAVIAAGAAVEAGRLEEHIASIRMRKRAARQSGVPGVYWDKGKQKWQVGVKRRHLGYFDTVEAATLALLQESASKV